MSTDRKLLVVPKHLHDAIKNQAQKERRDMLVVAERWITQGRELEKEGYERLDEDHVSQLRCREELASETLPTIDLQLGAKNQ